MAKKKDAPLEIVRGGKPDKDDITEGMSIYQLADLYGKLQARRRRLLEDPVVTRVAEVESHLKARIARDYTPETVVEIRGKQYTVTFGPAAKAARKVRSMADAFKALGKELFLKLAKISVTDIETELGAAKAAELISDGEGYIDKRDISVKARSEVKDDA